jgi:Cof subfamily protein (haloacid dehalogenase superfamily)
MKNKNTTGYKLIALDLDDTLLTASKEISPENKKAIDRAVRAGVRVVLASGRTIEGMQFVIDALGHKDYAISAGGAVVTDPKGREIYSRPVPSGTARQIMAYAASQNAYFQIFCGSDFYFIGRTAYTDEYEKNCRFVGREDPGIMDWTEINTSKILIIDEQERIDQMRAELAPRFPDVKPVYSQNGYLEIVSATASKGAALSFIAGELDLSKEQLIAVGDSEIDISMLRAAGLGVAVAGARKEVLRIADHITAPSDEHGVAAVINQFIFGEQQ